MAGAGGDATGGQGGGELECLLSEKPCDGGCVRRDDPLFGCDADSCEPCLFDGAEATCSGGECAMRACLATNADCDGDVDNGCEAHLATSTEHCAACGQACNVANGTAVCQGSVCAVGQCDSGYRDCDGDPLNGCETNTDYDPDNCDTCDHECPGGDYAICTDGNCGTTACAPGTGDCDDNPSNGCETDTTSSSDHCGFCNNPCGFPNGVGACNSSVCALSSCTAPYDNCDGNDANGCETDLTQSGSHCGSCDFSCEGGACANGCLPGLQHLDIGQRPMQPAPEQPAAHRGLAFVHY